MLEADRLAFSQQVLAQTRAAESAMQRLKAEEERLTRLRDEVAHEKEQFEIRKASVSCLVTFLCEEIWEPGVFVIGLLQG